MRFSFFTLFILLQTLIFSQEKKYQSLLWEIRGNNLSEPSYLYGTMHVSERIAFRLSDVFFDAILSTDKVALESNPENWLDEMQESPEKYFFQGGSYNNNKGFYRSFNRTKIENYQLAGILKINDFLTNGILYRTTESNEDYQEQTYLDMFIYQVGIRTYRPVVALEGFKESRDLVEKAARGNQGYVPKPWTKKLLKDKPFYVVMQDAYRERDLDLLDSLNRGLYSEDYVKYMLVERNANMVRRMDSIMQNKETLFAGVGAAHLPGDGGMIEMLRQKGYQVSPMIGKYTDLGKQKKDELDVAYVDSEYKIKESSDQLIKVPAPTKLYELSYSGVDLYISPDVKNGAFLNIARINTYDFLSKFPYKSSPERLDSLFFENIPGEILTKKKIKINGFDAWDIQNQTKSLDRQHFLIVLTPLEVINFNLSGKNQFVADKEQDLFPLISLKEMNGNWETISPLQSGYSVKIPSYHKISNNSEFGNLMGSPQIMAYDPTDESYYFLIQNVLNDIEYLEETEFEHRRIHQQFYQKLDRDSIETKYDSLRSTYYSKAVLNDEVELKLKSIINGSHYYLMGSTSKKNAKQFFDSFTIKPFNYYREKEEYKDTILHFTNKVPIKPAPDYYDSYNHRRYDSNKNVFEEVVKEKRFQSESKKQMYVKYYQFHKYKRFENVDSLWQDVGEANERKNSLLIKTKKAYQNKNGNEVFDVVFEDTASLQNIKARYLLKNGVLYSMKALVDKDYKNDDLFVEEFFANFEPSDSIIGRSIFEQKAPLFFEDIKSEEDSIRNSALQSIRYLDFNENDIPTLIKTIESFDFKEDELKRKVELIEKLGEIESLEVEQFLSEFYTKQEDKSIIQLAILNALANQNNPNAFKKVLSLMEYDLPLPSTTDYGHYQLFRNMLRNHKNSKVVFPEILQFFSVPEYKESILDFTLGMIDSAAIKPKVLNRYTKELITNGKLEIKRAKSRYLAQKQETQSYYRDRIEPAGAEVGYDRLLGFLPKGKNVKEFQEKFAQLESTSVDLYRIQKAILANQKPSPNTIKKLWNHKDARVKLYELLYENEQLTWLPRDKKLEELASAIVKERVRLDEEENDSIKLLKFKELSYNKEKYKVWIYKVFQNQGYNDDEVIPRIAFVAFQLDENENLNPSKIIFNDHEVYIDDESLNDTYKTIGDRVLFHNKKRIRFTDNYNYY